MAARDMNDVMADNERIVRDFITAWSRLDPAELAGYFTEDGCYHNIPAAPVRGRAEVERFIRAFTANWTRTEWELVSIGAAGDRVYAERIDRTETKQGNVDLPCLGVFEMADGKIREWRDYFDLSTFTRAMQA
jgi:limonene-1,2-epoxide hydrolase